MCFVSFNINQTSSINIVELCQDVIRETGPNTILLLQEAEHVAEVSLAAAGLVLLRSTGCRAAIAIPRHFEHFVGFVMAVGASTMCIVLRGLAVLSVYLPDMSKSNHEYFDCMHELSNTIHSLNN